MTSTTNYFIKNSEWLTREVYEFTTGTHKIASLQNATYYDLISAFGKPTISEESADGKIQIEWVFNYNGQPFTIYDWKTFNREYTINELTVWSIGGKQRDYDFFEFLEEAIDKTVLIKFS